MFVERIVASLASRGENRIVRDGSSKARSGTLGKSVGCSTTNDKGSNDGSSYDSSDSSGSDTSDGANRESTSSGRVDVATLIIGNIATRDGTVVSGRAHNGNFKTSSSNIADHFVTDIGVIANNRRVFAGVSGISGSGVAFIDGASIIVIAKVDNRQIRVGTSSGRFTGIISTSVVVVARGKWSPCTSGAEGYSRGVEDTLIYSTSVLIIAIRS